MAVEPHWVILGLMFVAACVAAVIAFKVLPK